jgi:outer membrane protein assembly factor BamB
VRHVLAQLTAWTVMALLSSSSSRAVADWPTYRHDGARSGNQPVWSALSDPRRVRRLAVQASWRLPGVDDGFVAAPIVHADHVYVGGSNGVFYALDARSLRVVWQFPRAGEPALAQRWHCSGFPSNRGIAASATLTRIGARDAVIFGAPDNSLAPHYGSGRLFALDAETGRLIWASPTIAAITDTIVGSATGRHEQIGYSSPLVLGNRVYVGVSDACADHPVQTGRVASVDLASGRLIPEFQFAASGSRGGGVWSSVATDKHSLFVTTGNAHCYPAVPACPQSAPTPDYASSILELRAGDGQVAWQFQPVPFPLDSDADFGAGPTVSRTKCGRIVTSIQKDGWVYGIGTNGPDSLGRVRWQFPADHYPFYVGDGTRHVGSARTNYVMPQAVWHDESFVTSRGAGHGSIEALDMCAADSVRVAWLMRVPNATTRGDGMSAPSVSGGIIYVGTNEGGIGHVMAFADPRTLPPAGQVCLDPDVPPNECAARGSRAVAVPQVLAAVPVAGGIRAEPVLAYGRVYVTTTNGYLYELSP